MRFKFSWWIWSLKTFLDLTAKDSRRTSTPIRNYGYLLSTANRARINRWVEHVLPKSSRQYLFWIMLKLELLMYLCLLPFACTALPLFENQSSTLNFGITELGRDCRNKFCSLNLKNNKSPLQNVFHKTGCISTPALWKPVLLSESPCRSNWMRINFCDFIWGIRSYLLPYKPKQVVRYKFCYQKQNLDNSLQQTSLTSFGKNWICPRDFPRASISAVASKIASADCFLWKYSRKKINLKEFPWKSVVVCP